jgi:hypothetical protein
MSAERGTFQTGDSRGTKFCGRRAIDRRPKQPNPRSWKALFVIVVCCNSRHCIKPMAAFDDAENHTPVENPLSPYRAVKAVIGADGDSSQTVCRASGRNIKK